MSDTAIGQRYLIKPDSKPGFARYSRLHEDRARGRFVILAPERAYELDPIAVAVLQLCDGRRSLADIANALARTYSAPVEAIAKDVTKMLQGLADKRILRDGPDPFLPPPVPRAAASYALFAGGPAGLLAELTHRCPLQCPYCSNPLELERSNTELTADEWGEAFRQAAAMGVLQLHLSGGEPTVRRDLDKILAHGVGAGLYTNLITAGVLISEDSLSRLAALGLDHVQVSLQDVVPENADRISGYKGGLEKKRDVARWASALGIGLTINAPIHRQNIDHLPAIIDFAVEVGAQRLEVAHIQYYAWAQRNRAALIPTREKFLETVGIVDRAKESLAGILNFDFVIHDYYARLPKACMGGWGRSIVVVTPSGRVLPCHAAQTLPGLVFDNVRERALADIWRHGAAFEAFRGEAWMKDPCRSCDRRTVDFGGCRCQAFAVAGDASMADPACHLSPDHERFASYAEMESQSEPPPFVYRRLQGAVEA
jgi:pyrroloquinoline quinone biosynthesis protein E